MFPGRWSLLIVPGILALAAAPALGEDGQNEFYLGDLGQAIAAMLIFLLLLAVLGKWAWKPILHQLHLREKRVSDAITQSQQREQESQELLAHYKAQLARAQADAEAVLAQGRKEAALARHEIIEEARREARRSIDQARSEIDQARADALRELYDKTASLATDMAGRIIQRNITEQDQTRLLEESVRQMAQRGEK